MKKSIRSFALVSVLALSLASCGLSEVDYDAFHEAATGVESNTYNYVEFDGSYKTTVLGVSATVDMTGVTATKTSNGWGTADGTEATQTAVATVLIADTASTVAEDESYTYYDGDGFKVVYSEDGKEYNEWDKYGMLTKTTDGTNTITLKWSTK